MQRATLLGLFLVLASAVHGQGNPSYIVTAASRVEGYDSLDWQTDLRFFNPGQDTVIVRIEYIPEGVNNAGSFLFGNTISLAPLATRIFLDNVIPGVTVPLEGVLRISYESQAGTPPSPTPMMVSRAYFETADGTFGHRIPTAPVTGTAPDHLYLAGLVEDSGFETNLKLVNLGSDTAQLTISVLADDGGELGSFETTVSSFQSRFFLDLPAVAGLSADIERFTLKVTTNGNNILTHAVVIDRITGDSVLVSDERTDGGRVYVPDIGYSSGAQGIDWYSEVVLLNPTQSSMYARIEYLPALTAQVPSYLLIPSLSPGQAFRAGAGYPPLSGQPDPTFGHLVVTGALGTDLPVIAARTYTVGINGGRIGQTVLGIGESDLIREGESGFIVGVSNTQEIDRGFRSNLTLSNTHRWRWTRVLITVLDTSGAHVGQPLDMYLVPSETLRFALYPMIGVDFNTAGTATVEVLEGGPVLAFASHIDNQSGDAMMIPAQKVE